MFSFIIITKVLKLLELIFFFLYTDNEFEKMSYDFKIFFYHVIYISF